MRTLLKRTSENLPSGSARLLATSHLVDSIAKGIFLSGSIVYFTKISDLTAVQVSVGLSAAGASGFLASVLFGVVADRLGARLVLLAALCLQAVGFMLYPLVHGPAFFFVLIVLLGFVEYGGGPAFGVLIGQTVAQDERVKFRAVLRTVWNVGFSLGSGLTALALLGGMRSLQALPILSAVLLLLSAGQVLRLPLVASEAAAVKSKKLTAVREPHFLAVVALSAVLALHGSIILVVLPLWILKETAAPDVLVALILIANTIFVVLFQVRASRGSDSVSGAAILARRSSLWLGLACGLAALSGYGGAVMATLAIALAALAFTLSELQQSASGWGLSFGLAPVERQGEYLGAFQLHIVAQNVIGPGAVSALVLASGTFGWLAVAALVLLAGLLIETAVRRSLEFREAVQVQ